jgi:AcrR family transcriptional regulator
MRGTKINKTQDKVSSKSEETRRRILDASARLFREQGYSIRLADVADAAGVKTGSLYYHFNGRDDLVDEVLKIAMETLDEYVRQALEDLPASATPLDRLKAAVRADARMALELSDYSAANTRVFPVITGEMREKHYVRHKKHGNLFHGLLRAAESSGHLRPGLDLPTIRMLILGAISWTAEWYRPNHGRSAQLVIDQLLTMVFDGIQNSQN